MRPSSTDPVALNSRRVFRLVVAVAGGLTLTTLSGIAIPGLAPVLALQLLLAPSLPGLGYGLLLMLLVLVGTEVIHAFAISFADRPVPFVGCLVLLSSLGFLFQPRLPLPSMLFLVTLALVPVWIAQSGGLCTSLVIAVPVALGICWVVDALLPLPSPQKSPAAPRPPAPLLPAVALYKALIHLPVQVFYIQSPSAFSMAGIITLIVILNLPTRAATARVLAARILGNIVGGLGALVAFTLIYLQWSPLMLLLASALGALILARELQKGGAQAPTVTIAFVSFTMLLGIAVSETLGGEPVDLVARIFDIGVIAAYGVAASSLIRKGYAEPARV